MSIITLTTLTIDLTKLRAIKYCFLEKEAAAQVHLFVHLFLEDS